jgi:hypothetical protein
MIISTPRRHRYLLPQCAPDGGGPAVRSASLLLRLAADGAFPVRDLAYERALTLRVGRTGASYVDLDSVAEGGQRLRMIHVGALR